LEDNKNKKTIFPRPSPQIDTLPYLEQLQQQWVLINYYSLMLLLSTITTVLLDNTLTGFSLKNIMRLLLPKIMNFCQPLAIIFRFEFISNSLGKDAKPTAERTTS